MDEGVFIGIGSNLGDRLAFCQRAILELGQVATLRHISSLYETEPVDAPLHAPPQAWFYNAVVEVATSRSPRQMLTHCQEIEQACGRERTIPKGPRTLDLDILFWGSAILNEADLIVPHPEAHRRSFVLMPLAEIAPTFRHPLLSETMEFLLSRQAPCVGPKIERWMSV
jgi:2-amino-4-hydroxy-6-hydroxymethyldihydropteridine diphosphokinase